MADKHNHIIGKKENALFKSWKKQGHPSLHTKYKLARNGLSKILKRARRDFFRILDVSDPKLFWKTVKKLTHHSTTVPVLNHDAHKATTSQEKADVLSDFFKKCFNDETPPLSFSSLDVFVADSNCCPDEFVVTVEEVARAFLSDLGYKQVIWS